MIWRRVFAAANGNHGSIRVGAGWIPAQARAFDPAFGLGPLLSLEIFLQGTAHEHRSNLTICQTAEPRRTLASLPNTLTYTRT